MPPFATVDNPLDVTGQVIKEPEILTNVTRPLLAEASVGSLLVAVVPGGPQQATDKADAVVASMANSSKPVAFAVMGDEVVLPDGFAERLRRANIPFFRSPERALRALAHVGRHGGSRANSESRGRAIDLPPIVLPGPGIAPEYVGKKILSQIGIVTPKGELAVELVQAERIADEVGYPVALKAQSSALAHKSEAGGVLIGISDKSALRKGWEVLNANVRTANADLVLDGILVEVMVPTGVEFMIGAKRDPQWGVVLMVGLGGIWVEVMGTCSCCLPACRPPKFDGGSCFCNQALFWENSAASLRATSMSLSTSSNA